MEDFDKAIKLAPDEHQHYGNRGELNLNLENYKAAFEDYNKAVEMTQMRNPKYVNNRGWASFKLGNLDVACKDFVYASEHGNPVSKINVERYCNK
jgi:tetratricopeptide (TPR) repeat protein